MATPPTNPPPYCRRQWAPTDRRQAGGSRGSFRATQTGSRAGATRRPDRQATPPGPPAVGSRARCPPPTPTATRDAHRWAQTRAHRQALHAERTPRTVPRPPTTPAPQTALGIGASTRWKGEVEREVDASNSGRRRRRRCDVDEECATHHVVRAGRWRRCGCRGGRGGVGARSHLRPAERGRRGAGVSLSGHRQGGGGAGGARVQREQAAGGAVCPGAGAADVPGASGTTLSKAESTDVFFAVTKLFSCDDAGLRRLTYLAIKELARGTDEVIIVTNCLTKDITSTVDTRRANATRVLCRVTDAAMVAQIERYLKQELVDRNANVASAALVGALTLLEAGKGEQTVRRWSSEVTQALTHPYPMVQYHALALLYRLRRRDRLALSKLVQDVARQGARSPLTAVLLLRCVGQVIEAEGGASGANARQLISFLESMLRHRGGERHADPAGVRQTGGAVRGGAHPEPDRRRASASGVAGQQRHRESGGRREPLGGHPGHHHPVAHRHRVVGRSAAQVDEQAAQRPQRRLQGHRDRGRRRRHAVHRDARDTRRQRGLPASPGGVGGGLRVCRAVGAGAARTGHRGTADAAAGAVRAPHLQPHHPGEPDGAGGGGLGAVSVCTGVDVARLDRAVAAALSVGQ
eukprot:ctg_110.g62